MLVFKNPGLMDTTAMITHGISAKEGDNPIGVFGTGLKYAIAIILRNGGAITIYRGLKAYVFSTRKKTIKRGDKDHQFQIVTMNGKEVGFTDRLGLNWEIWQAYRELWSNTRDEKGHVYSVDSTTNDDKMTIDTAVQRGHTVIVVKSYEMELCHHQRHSIILGSEAMATLPLVEIHPGENEYIFYKGIRVYKMPKKTMYTYNLIGNELLTEDRTLMYPMLIGGRLARAIVQGTYMPFLESVLCRTETDGKFEDSLPFDNARDTKPSAQFMEVADRLYASKKLSAGASQLFKKYQDTMPGYRSPYIVTLNEIEMAVFDKAHTMVLDKVPSPGFAGTRIEFKSHMETRRVTAGKSLITIDHSIIAKGPFELAKALLEGLAMTKGGSFVEQFTTFVLTGKWIPDELVQTPHQREWDEMPF